MMFGDPSSDHEGSGVHRVVGHLGQHLLVAEQIDPELPVGLIVHPELASEGSVGDSGYDDGDLVLPCPVHERVLVVHPLSDLPDDLVGGHRVLAFEDLIEHGEDLSFEDLSVAVVGNENISEPGDLVLLPELGIVHHEVAVIVVLIGP